MTVVMRIAGAVVIWVVIRVVVADYCNWRDARMAPTAADEDF